MEDFVNINKLIEQGEREKAIESLLELSKNTQLYEKCYELLWDCYTSLGEIELALDSCNKYLKIIYEKKRIEKGLSFIEKVKKIVGEKYFLDVIKLKFLILKNDGDTIDSIYKFNEDSTDYYLDKNYRTIDLVLDDMTNLPEFKSKNIYFVMIDKLLKKLEASGDRKDARELIKKILEYILYYPQDKIIEKHLFKYLQLKEMHHLGDLPSAFLDMNNIESITNEQLKNYLVARTKNKDGKNKKEDEEEFDLATDLFKVEDFQGLVARQVDNDEYFLKKIGIKNDMDRDILEKSRLEDMSKIEENVLGSLKRYVGKKSYQDESDLKKIEMAIRKSIDMLDEELKEKMFFDVVIMLKFMELHDIALRFINIVDEQYLESKEIADKLNFEYLRIVILIEMKNFYDAVLAIDKVTSCYPLLQREKVCFMYLKAESLKFLNDLKGAMAIYRWIKKITPNYRQVKRRMTEIE